MTSSFKKVLKKRGLVGIMDNGAPSPNPISSNDGMGLNDILYGIH